MDWNGGVRRTHRWLSVVFTALVAANFVALWTGGAPAWLVYAPLPPLLAMMATGLWMFALPYAERRRARSRV